MKIEDIGEVNLEQANFLINGEALNSLKKNLPDSLVQTVITSPPYYGQRDYCTEEQIGIEENPDEYINKLLEIFDEIKRVLKEDGTLWINLGDKYIRWEFSRITLEIGISS